MVAIGGATALDTLCSQSLRSAQTETLSRHLQQSLVVLSMLFITAITPLWLASGHLFVSLGQGPEFAGAVGRFLALLLPAGYCQMVAETLKKFCQVQGDSGPVGTITLMAALLGSLANVMLVRFSTLGMDSVPLAFLLYQLVTVGLLVRLIARRQKTAPHTIRRIETWAQLWDGLLGNMSLAVTGILTIATEWWSFEILAIMAARLSPSEIGAQSVSCVTPPPTPCFRRLPVDPHVCGSHLHDRLSWTRRGHQPPHWPAPWCQRAAHGAPRCSDAVLAGSGAGRG